MTFRGGTHMTSKKTVQFLRPPTHLVQLRPKFFHHLDLGCPTSNEPLPSSLKDNQSIKRKHKPKDDYYMLSGLSFRSTFVLSINSLTLSSFSMISFHLAEANLVPRAILKNWKPYFRLPFIAKKMRWGQGWAEASLSTFLRLYYILFCAVVQKYHEMFFLKMLF